MSYQTGKPEKQVRLCKDCKHYEKVGDGVFDEHYCLREHYYEISPVIGMKHDRGVVNAYRERGPSSWNIWWLFGDRPCGPEARYWEPKA